MTEAYIVGAGQSPFGSFPDESYRSLFDTAFERALSSVDGYIDPARIDEAFVGSLGIGGRQIGLSAPAETEHVGLHGIGSARVENACASSGYAFRLAVMAIRSGMADVALAGGYEVMTDMSADRTKWWLGVSGETEWERMAGTTFSGVYAQMASAYLEAYDATKEDLSRIAVKNHRNGAENPDAHLGFECTLEEATSSPSVAHPLDLYDCCPTSDGASVVLVARPGVAEDISGVSIRVAGAGAASDRVGLFERDSLTSIPASRMAADRAYREAEIEPDQVDFAEVHDCFTIAELLAYDDLRFSEPGSAPSLVRSGVTAPTGARPVNLSGGLKSKGHPIGATGTGQIVEIFRQFTDRAHVQIADPGIALAHNVGGSGGSATVHVLTRETEPMS
jgi:acetyl-CoA acetyltransferase